MAEPSGVDHVFGEGVISVLEKEVNCVPLPGHSINHFGIEIEGVLFCGDAFISRELLEKHFFPLYFNVSEEKKTLKRLIGTEEGYYVSSHDDAGTSVSDIITANLERIEFIETAISQVLDKEKSAEALLSEILKKASRDMRTHDQYFLYKASLMAFLASLKEELIVQLRKTLAMERYHILICWSSTLLSASMSLESSSG